MDVKYQVFVSSTFEDLKDERRAVIEAILNLGHIPVGMEVFQANDETQWTYIKNRIDESDYYVLIVAERYGSEQDGKSYTQMEYEYAIEKGVPTVAFLLDGEARKQLPQHKVEYDKREKVESFRQLCQQKLVRFWKNSDDLSGKVAMTLVEQMRTKPRTGWVRADSVPNTSILLELAHLSEEKRKLEAKLETFTASKEINIPPSILERIAQLESKRLRANTFENEDEASGPSLLEIFLQLHSILNRGTEHWEMSERVRGHYPDLDYSSYDLVEQAASDLAAHRILEFQRGQINGRGVRLYRLTNYGKDFVKYAVQHSDKKIAG